ncbi:hypothetical protein NGB36_13935 [Streptomyces sp. RB6PN25]|uniref:Major facilitator superfamily (MFS) profile domain-containing protein n=1 Tax=Streptomyces humicola TaxID=2953240 RepID=A0ABT1PVI0_9ACTN|nr:hypothetical protein [Streptomyces humicola]MCQ4081677.1 hypothetical protein [Streptomyces humicola]
MIGSILLAPLADRLGRRTLFQVNLRAPPGRAVPTPIGIPYAASRLVSALLPLGSLTLLSAIGAGGSTPAARCCRAPWPSPSGCSGRAPTTSKWTPSDGPTGRPSRRRQPAL